jgi:hypothetical protein
MTWAINYGTGNALRGALASAVREGTDAQLKAMAQAFLSAR